MPYVYKMTNRNKTEKTRQQRGKESRWDKYWAMDWNGKILKKAMPIRRVFNRRGGLF